MDANIINYTKAAVFVAAAIAMAIGTVGPSLAQGMIGRSACESVGKYPESNSKIRMAMIISMALVETCALYVLLVSFMIITRIS